MKTLKLSFLFFLGMFVSFSPVAAKMYAVEYAEGKFKLVDFEEALKAYRKREKVKKFLKYVAAAMATGGAIYCTDKYIGPMIKTGYSSPLATAVDPYLEPVIKSSKDLYDSYLKESVNGLHKQFVETKYGKIVNEKISGASKTVATYFEALITAFKEAKEAAFTQSLEKPKNSGSSAENK